MHEVATQSILSELSLINGMNHGPYFIGWWTPREGPPGAVGRIVQWLPKDGEKPRRYAYVCLPSFKSGIGLNGQCVDHGTERLTEVCSMDDMRRMFVTALKQLKEIVANEYHYGN